MLCSYALASGCALLYISLTYYCYRGRMSIEFGSARSFVCVERFLPLHSFVHMVACSWAAILASDAGCTFAYVRWRRAVLYTESSLYVCSFRRSRIPLALPQARQTHNALYQVRTDKIDQKISSLRHYYLHNCQILFEMHIQRKIKTFLQ